MANATKLFSEFKDLAGQQWRINIHDSEYSGTSPAEFTVGSSGFQIQYSGDTENIFQPIIGSSIQFEFIEETAAHTTFLNLLATATESRYTITIEKLVSSVYELNWFGVLLSDQWSRTNEPKPRSSMLTASDDLGNLKSVLYKNGASAYTGTASLKQHLLNCLNKTRATHPFGSSDVFLRVADDFRSTSTTVTSKFLANIRTHHESFWNVDDDGQQSFMDSLAVLSNICQSQNARIFLANGVFHFVPIGTYQNDTSIVFHQYATDGTFLSTATAVETSLAVGTDLKHIAGNEERFTPPLSEAKRTRKYNGNAPTLYVPFLNETDFTTTQSDLGVDYSGGIQLNLSGFVAVGLPGVDPSFSDGNVDRIGRIGVRVTFKCGNQYATAPHNFNDTAQFWFNEYAGVPYNAVGYGPLVWQTTAASTLFVSQPFDRNNSNSVVVPLQYTTPELPSLQSGLEITLAIFLVEHDGTLVDIDSDLNVSDSADFSAQNIKVFKADLDGGGDEITYTAVGDSENRAIKIDDTVLLGDAIGDSSRGVLQVLNNTDWIDSAGWTSLNYTGSGVGINRLAVNEILRAMRFPVPIHAGSLHVAAPDTIGELVSMLNVLEIDSDTFIFTEFSFNVNSRILDFECARIQRDTSPPTETDGDKGGRNPDVYPGDTNPIGSDNNVVKSLGAFGTDISAIEAKTDFITITQSVNLDTVESTVASHESLLSILKQTFQSKSDGSNTVTKVVYDQGQTDGLEMSLTQTTAAFTSNSGDTQMSISEASPGVFRVDLSDDNGNSNLAIYATAGSGNRVFVGIGRTASVYALEVAGTVSASAFYVGSSAISIDHLADVDTTTVAPTTNQVLKWDGTNWSPADDDSGGGGGGGSDSFNTISVTGQSDVVADSGNDTLTLASGANISIGTNASTDTITFSVSSQPSFSAITISGNATIGGNLLGVNVISTGFIASGSTLSSVGNATIGGNISVTGTSTFGGTATYSTGIVAGKLEFIGGGTSIIEPVTYGGNLPADLEIRSNGNVVVVLDYDDNETGQSFKIQNGDGTTIFQVDETGVTTGLLTTATPTISNLQSGYQQGNPGTANVGTTQAGRTFVGKIYNSSGTEQTANPVTIDSSGNVSFTVPSTVATNYELRIFAVDAGKLRSLETTGTFNVTQSLTFTHFRIKGYTSTGVATADRIYLGTCSFYTGQNQTGTKYPTTNLTSNTSESGVTISAGHQYSSTYAPWKAFDNLGYSGWWSLGNSNAALNWIQIEFDTAKTFQSVRMDFYGNNTQADNVKIFGSNTGNFTGEEVEIIDISGVDAGYVLKDENF